MRWLFLTLVILLMSPMMAQAQSATAKAPVTQEELDKKLQQTLESVKGMMSDLEREVKVDLEATKDEALGAIKEAIEKTKSRYGVTEEQLIAIGVGAMVGAVAVDIAGGGGIATMIGLMVGGAVGNWLVKPTELDDADVGAQPKKTNLRSARRGPISGGKSAPEFVQFALNAPVTTTGL